MKPKLLFCLTPIIIFVLFFNLKCGKPTPNPYLFFISYVGVRPLDTYILNEGDRFVPIDIPALFLNMSKLNYTLLLRYKIDSTEYNDTLDIYNKLEYDGVREKDTYFLNDLLIVTI